MSGKTLLVAFVGSLIMGWALSTGGIHGDSWQFWVVVIVYNVVWIFAGLDHAR